MTEAPSNGGLYLKGGEVVTQAFGDLAKILQHNIVRAW